MIDLITSSYAQQFGGVAANAPQSVLDAYISVASRRIATWCQRDFYARRYSADRYDAISQHSLSLRYAPLIMLNQVTMFPDGPAPLTFLPAVFDIDYEQSRLTFQYNANGTFYQRMANGGPFASPLKDIVSVDYFAGYGWVTTLTAAISAGSNVPLPLAASYGRLPCQPPWQAAKSSQVMLDSDQETEEVVDVTWAAGQLTAVNVLYPHASASYVSGGNVPDDAQFACALLVMNLLNVGDLTKQEEMIGRLGGYTYVQRKLADVIMTPEIIAPLARYQEIVA